MLVDATKTNAHDAAQVSQNPDVRALMARLACGVEPPATELRKLHKLRDEFVEKASAGRFNDAATKEWFDLPIEWRMIFLLLAGVGEEAFNDAALIAKLRPLAGRSWREMPPPERDAIKSVVRRGKPMVAKLIALAART